MIRKKFFKYLIYIGILTILTLTLSEVFLRTIYGGQQTAYFNHENSNVPKHRYDGIFFSKLFDEYGFRKSSFSCPSDKKNLKVLLVGDSNIAAVWLENNEEHFGSKIIKNSINKFQCLAVDTFGVNGLGPTELIYAIEHYTSIRKYDYVIFNIFADNDLSDIVRSNIRVNKDVDQYNYCYIKRNFINNLKITRVIRKISFNIFGINLPFTGEQSSKNKPSNCLSSTRKGLTFKASYLKDYADEDFKIFKKGLKQPYNIGSRYDIEFAAQLNTELEQFVTSELIAIDNFFYELSQEREFNGLYSIIPSKYDVVDITEGHGTDYKNYFKTNFKKYRELNLINFIEQNLKNFSTINYFQLFTDCDNCYYTYNNHWTTIAMEKASNVIINHIINHAKSTM